MNTCKFVKSNLSAYIDGVLSGSDAEKIKNHLENCEECKAEYEKLLIISNVLLNEDVKAPEGYMASLKARIAAEETSKKGFFAHVNYKVLSGAFAVLLLAVSFKTPLYDNLLRINNEKYNTVVTDVDVKKTDENVPENTLKQDGDSLKKSGFEAGGDKAEKTEKTDKNEGNNKSDKSSELNLNENTAVKRETSKTTKNDENKTNLPRVSSNNITANENASDEKNYSEKVDVAPRAAGADEGIDTQCYSSDQAHFDLGDINENAKSKSTDKESESTVGVSSAGGANTASFKGACNEISGNSSITVSDNKEALSILSKYNITKNENVCVLKSDEYALLKSSLSDYIISCDENINGANEVTIQIFFK